MNQQFKKTSVWLPLVVAVTLVVGMWLGKIVFTDSRSGGARDKLDEIMRLVEKNYVDVIDTDSLVEVTIPDLLAHLDPHTTYIPASDLQVVNDELGGSFSGVGIQYNLLNDTINVLEVIPGGPSEKAGLLAGDRIVSINDSVIPGNNWDTNRVLRTLRGEKGSSVKVEVVRPLAKHPLTFEIIRDDIPVNTIDAYYTIEPGVGYIHINKFGANTFSEFLQAMILFKAEGVDNFIIDLRGNGGGYMEPAVLMANEFLEGGLPIVSMHGQNSDHDGATFSDGRGSFKSDKVVVLIDELSASASEIFAGAIQDNDRGLVIGRRSFGKGLVQHQHEFADSSAIRLTIARYYTPSGRCIQKTYAPGSDYANDINNRYNHGEFYSADSIKLDKTLMFETLNGRTVYGGGGIMPDIFVPNDTTGITSWYLDVANAGLFHKWTFMFTDENRQRLSSAVNVEQLKKLLPSDAVLLNDFVHYTMREGIPVRMGYVNQSRDLIVNNLKALITRNMLGTQAFYEIDNSVDPTVIEALDAISRGDAEFPLMPDKN
ncbi:MAG: S41 family peptidase [Lachnoclostridium sp.]|nr:S41 family peptidase [Lachnoclostridium sp.]